MRLGSASVLLVAFVTALPAASFHPDSFEMRVVAEVPAYPHGGLPCGDADHDGHREFYAVKEYPGDSIVLVAAEHVGGNQFELMHPGIERRVNWLVRDLDGDGRSELVVRAYNDMLVYEARDSLSFPADLSWSGAVGHAFQKNVIVADLDCDSALELVGVLGQDYSTWVFENRGDDSFELVIQIPDSQVPGPALYVAQSYDLDLDGLPELVLTTEEDYVAFYETVGDDTLELKQAVNVAPWARADVAPAHDMDRDGRPEMVVSSVNWGNSAAAAVLESPADDSFAVVWTYQSQGNYLGSMRAAVGDVDGDGVEEFVASDGYTLRLFRCTGPDEYEVFWELEWAPFELVLYDINSDGRDELLYKVGQTTVIREYVEVGVAERELRRLEGVQVTPSVVRPGVAVALEGLEGRFSVHVLDAAGRVVAEPEDGVWRTGGVRPGAYFFRVSSGGLSSTRKVLVVE